MRTRSARPHIRMMPENLSEGNHDPSSELATTGGDTPLAVRNGPAVLPPFAGGGSWRDAVAGSIPDRSADRSRTPRGIRCKNPLTEKYFAMNRRARPQAGLDTGNRSVEG